MVTAFNSRVEQMFDINDYRYLDYHRGDGIGALFNQDHLSKMEFLKLCLGFYDHLGTKQGPAAFREPITCRWEIVRNLKIVNVRVPYKGLTIIRRSVCP